MSSDGAGLFTKVRGRAQAAGRVPAHLKRMCGCAIGSTSGSSLSPRKLNGVFLSNFPAGCTLRPCAFQPPAPAGESRPVSGVSMLDALIPVRGGKGPASPTARIHKSRVHSEACLRCSTREQGEGQRYRTAVTDSSLGHSQMPEFKPQLCFLHQLPDSTAPKRQMGTTREMRLVTVPGFRLQSDPALTVAEIWEVNQQTGSIFLCLYISLQFK